MEYKVSPPPLFTTISSEAKDIFKTYLISNCLQYFQNEVIKTYSVTHCEIKRTLFKQF